MTIYEKNTSAVAAGGVFLGLGMAGILSGIGCFLYDKLADKHDSQPTANSVTVKPVVNFGYDSASTGIAVTF